MSSNTNSGLTCQALSKHFMCINSLNNTAGKNTDGIEHQRLSEAVFFRVRSIENFMKAMDSDIFHQKSTYSILHNFRGFAGPRL